MQSVFGTVTSITFVIVCLVAELQFVQCEKAIDACTMTTRNRRPAKRCETIDEIIVESREYSPNDNNVKAKTWCIVFNVDSDLYDSEILEVKLVGYPFAVGYSTINFIKFITNGAQLSTARGQNKLALFSHDTSQPLAEIQSIKIGGKQLCKPNPKHSQYNEEVSTVKNNMQRQDQFKFLNHCKEMPSKLTYTSFCPGLKIEAKTFMIDKLTLNGESYWCAYFNGGSQRKFVKVTLSNEYCSTSWTGNSAQRTSGLLRTFFIGQHSETFEFSPMTPSPVPDIKSVTIDGIPICDYYKDLKQFQRN